jgi:hypothetical protein
MRTPFVGLCGLALAGALLAGCGGAGGADVAVADGVPADAGATAAPTVLPSPEAPGAAGVDEQREVAVYASVLRQAFTKDHTFGDSPSPFRRIYVVDALLSSRGRWTGTADRLSPATQRGIALELADLPPLEFIARADEALTRVGTTGPVEHRGAIYSLGPIVGTADRVEVNSGMRCGALCGLRITYVVVRDAAGWRVAGDTGVFTIS